MTQFGRSNAKETTPVAASGRDEDDRAPVIKSLRLRTVTCGGWRLIFLLVRPRPGRAEGQDFGIPILKGAGIPNEKLTLDDVRAIKSLSGGTFVIQKREVL
jgi:hypothetical protein